MPEQSLFSSAQITPTLLNTTTDTLNTTMSAATGNTLNQELTKRLYTVPAGARGNIPLPGPDVASRKRLVEKLLHNQKHFHTYFNDMRFHNHSTHHMFAIYALGATPELLDAAYATHVQYQKPLVRSPHSITDANFLDHLDEDEYYEAYLAYFLNYLDTHNIAETVDRFIFSPEYNYIPNLDDLNARDKKNGGKGAKQKTNNFWTGLAMTAVHPPFQTPIVPYSLFSSHPDFTAAPSASLLKRLASLTVTSKSAPSTPLKPTFSLHQRILADPSLTAGVAIDVSSPKKYEDLIEHSGDRLHELVTEWYEKWLEGATTNEEVESRLEAMVEEVIWGNVMWFGVGGWAGPGKKDGQNINADFYMMHLVTSAHFLPNFALLPSASNPATVNPPLSLANRLLLVRTYFAQSIGWYIARGRPALPLAEFYAATANHVASPIPPPSKREKGDVKEGTIAMMSFKSALEAGSNPWMRIIQNTLVHTSEHLCKLQRSLAFFAVKYGNRDAGDFAGSPLEGSEKLDSTLFARVAGLAMERLGLANEGGKIEFFDLVGFYGVERNGDEPYDAE
ncbi:hypothetical protein EVG20_g7066 [Dentipellis fragilis]|uniref:Uncharacterized protein n=1 Tax=Dentipellis fragilis TaxID=205917 RepID=A0A4Y9YIZ0_9AGAM|nr:hypothetical protein EVG20_g7066 [Dentipellis fragilis]